jgi:hypothetical protein
MCNERVRSNARQFLLRPGHQRADVEDVVLISDEYLVVAKRGHAGEIAEKTEIRARPTSSRDHGETESGRLAQPRTAHRRSPQSLLTRRVICAVARAFQRATNVRQLLATYVVLADARNR